MCVCWGGGVGSVDMIHIHYSFLSNILYYQITLYKYKFISVLFYSILISIHYDFFFQKSESLVLLLYDDKNCRQYFTG